MESSEDDAGTATNASRRASAREKDVGLAEDVNATSSFQQKASEARLSCRTPAMSEDNFDGDCLTSPSSHDVNTSTEAILDMIDEIVDGPGAPKRLPITSEFVDTLNEEIPTTSDNLNIIQESAKSYCENDSADVVLSVNITDSETTLPVVSETPAEPSTPSDISADVVKTESVDSLSASSSIPESDEKSASIESKVSVVLNVEGETSSSCKLPSIPSSCEGQTEQNVSDVSACESQDRTVKCVTSSDTRDNVTVESAESTSSDSNVSESKALNVEPQTRSPLRRKLIRPSPSDRRPDSTVSSTVDYQTGDIPAAAEQNSSENITKDVTSSSDAVPTIHGNVKPEEISNVSEINFCKAETSVSPPKKIKLVRQKIITGTSNRETPPSQISGLAEKEQCQSTSSEIHSISLTTPTIESSSIDSLSKPQDLNTISTEGETQLSPILDNSLCATESLPNVSRENHEKVSSNEHSQRTTDQTHLPKNNDSIKGPEKLISNPTETSVPDVNEYQTEQDNSSLFPTNSLELSTSIKGNHLEKDNISNIPESENKSIDFIPLRLSPRRKDHQFKSSIPELVSSELESRNIVPERELECSELKSRTSEPDSKNSKLRSTKNELELSTTVLESKSKKHELSNELDLRNDSEARSNELDSMSSECDTGSSDLVTQLTLPKSSNNEYKIKINELPSKCSDPQPNSGEVKQLKSQTTICELKSTECESNSMVFENKSMMRESETMECTSKTTRQGSVEELKSSELEKSSKEQEIQNTMPELATTESESHGKVTISKSSVLELKCTELSSMSTPPEEKILTQELQCAAPQLGDIEKDLNSTVPESKTIESGKSESCLNVQMESSHQDSSCSEVSSRSNEHNVTSNQSQLQKSNMVLRKTETQLIGSDIETMKPDTISETTEIEIKSSSLDTEISEIRSGSLVSFNCQPDTTNEQFQEDQKKVPPIKLNLSRSSMSTLSEDKLEIEQSSINKSNVVNEESDSSKQVPKLTIKLKQPEEMKSPVPKVTIKPIKPPTEQVSDDKMDSIQQVPCVTKINIKPIVKPAETIIDKPIKSISEDDKVAKQNVPEQLPSITKLNIKPILKPPEKINDIHRKSSSSEISESECSENDETTSTSDQASASDHGTSDIVPKVTIKLGKPGTESEGKFYTEKNVPKLTIKGIQQDEKLIISQSGDVQPEKVPKLTIKTVTKTESQPLSPKLNIKPLKPSDSTHKEGEISKIKISTELFSTSTESKESPHVPKITIKPVTRVDGEVRAPKKSNTICDSPEHIPVVTKINIKPILKPTDSGESSGGFDDKVPVVSKLNIKPVIKPKDNDLDSSLDDVPKITKLNIKPLKNPEDKNSEDSKDCDELNADIDENNIPVITKINIKPIIKPEEEKEKDSENQSSETGNSSDDNTDHIPVVTKLNIKPIIKPDDLQESSKSVSSSEPSIPIVTKLNIKPLVKPAESSPSSPKKEHSKTDTPSPTIPVVTKLNIKPVIRPEDVELPKPMDDDDKIVKNPPLVMKINMKSVSENFSHDNSLKDSVSNYVGDGLLSIAPKLSNEIEKSNENKEHKCSEPESVNDLLEAKTKVQSPKDKSEKLKLNCVPEEENFERTPIVKKPSLHSPINKSKQSDGANEKQHSPNLANVTKCDPIQTGYPLIDSNLTKEGKIALPNETHLNQENKIIKYRPSVQNCTLLKKLLENTRDSFDKNFEMSQIVNCTLPSDRSESTITACKNIVNSEHMVESGKAGSDKGITKNIEGVERSSTADKVNDLNKSDSSILHSMQELSEKVNESVTKPLEITIGDKITNQSSGQDSPRIILKINKTDHGPSAKIITEDVKRPDTILNYTENTQDNVNDKQSPKRHVANSRRKQPEDTSLNLSSGKRLRSSRIVENTEKSQGKRNIGKRRPSTETTPPQNKEKESDLSVLETKRLKLGQLLSGNKPLSVSPVVPSQTSPTKTNIGTKPGVKTVNHSLLNNENCSKNGNSKLHNILSNLQAKQMQSLAFNSTNCSEKAPAMHTDIECNTPMTSMSSSDAAEITHVENSHPELQQMIINESSDFRDLTGPEDTSQDPLAVDNVKPVEDPPPVVDIPKPVELTPQPKKRGRPRKIPLSEGAKPVALPVPALEERPQRSLRLMRDRPAILLKPRGGRGRGRGGRRKEATPPPEPETITVIETAPEEPVDEKPTGEIDPTSSRVKLPRMTEALDKMPSSCTTPLSSRRRTSSGTFSSTGEPSELKSLLDSTPTKDEFPNTPEPSSSGRGRGGRGSRGGRGRTPRGRGRGRGGGRGAMYMKETMGIYGRVCGPATTTVQLFEEETCMMDDNATPAKPSHLLDEDSQGSVKSSTNESNKMKKSKFADLFDSNKVWTAADVKEYMWPPSDKPVGDSKVMMIQEQVAMFLGVKSFKRRYPELQRRTIGGEERDYVLSKGLVTEALCDLGITAVDASEVLDIMLSDYPHKYEEFRSHQRERQLTKVVEEPPPEPKPEEKVPKTEIKTEKPVETKPELPKIDPEKTRQDMAAAAIASASEWNARLNALRRGACADLQSLSVLRARAAPAAPPARARVRPPAGFYPHALLPGQHQHAFRAYTPDQLRYFPLNTALAAPPAPPSVTDWSSESEPDWGSRCSSSDDSDAPTHNTAKRKKLTKVKRSSHTEASTSSVKEEPKSEEVVDTCRVCKLRLEANRKYTHERFLVCANCNAKLHPSCVELSADTIRKCREYPWQCAECKTCCSCRQPADDDKMLFCDLCDRGFHIYCVGLDTVPSGRWHCVECAVCKSCGARSPSGPAELAPAPARHGGPAELAPAPAAWHHQTRRGPGGHKLYSHSLCTPCARAYRIGRYCPLCERSFIGPKGTMQLVICKLCDRQLHQECVRQTGAVVRVLDHTCGWCRRGGITSRAAAVRLAPRTIATLFMAKRRFNKYAHRQYMESRLRQDAADDSAPPDDQDASAPSPPSPPSELV